MFFPSFFAYSSETILNIPSLFQRARRGATDLTVNISATVITKECATRRLGPANAQRVGSEPAARQHRVSPARPSPTSLPPCALCTKSYPV